jgi:hypothetical protein
MKFSALILAAAAVVDTTNAFAPVARKAVVGGKFCPSRNQVLNLS